MIQDPLAIIGYRARVGIGQVYESMYIVDPGMARGMRLEYIVWLRKPTDNERNTLLSQFGGSGLMKEHHAYQKNDGQAKPGRVAGNTNLKPPYNPVSAPADTTDDAYDRAMKGLG